MILKLLEVLDRLDPICCIVEPISSTYCYIFTSYIVMTANISLCHIRKIIVSGVTLDVLGVLLDFVATPKLFVHFVCSLNSTRTKVLLSQFCWVVFYKVWSTYKFEFGLISYQNFSNFHFRMFQNNTRKILCETLFIISWQLSFES